MAEKTDSTLESKLWGDENGEITDKVMECAVCGDLICVTCSGTGSETLEIMGRGETFGGDAEIEPEEVAVWCSKDKSHLSSEQRRDVLEYAGFGADGVNIASYPGELLNKRRISTAELRELMPKKCGKCGYEGNFTVLGSKRFEVVAYLPDAGEVEVEGIPDDDACPRDIHFFDLKEFVCPECGEMFEVRGNVRWDRQKKAV